MIPPTPTSTLFPYTTLFRSLMNKGNALQSQGRLAEAEAAFECAIEIREALVRAGRRDLENGLAMALVNKGNALRRSEEHTSELQSRFDLVCRLLLEKKKKQQ